MIEKYLLFLVRVTIIVMVMCGIAFNLFLVPMTSTDIGNNQIAIIIQCIVQWVISIPCFCVLVLAWRISSNMKSGRLFAFENAKRINDASTLLFISIVGFIIAKVLFYLLGWNKELIVHVIIIIVGLALLVMMKVLSHYIYNAAELQEESDFTV